LLLKSEINEDKPLVVGVSGAASLLDCSRDRIYSFIKSGELESYVEGTRRKITMASIERLGLRPALSQRSPWIRF
jgi:excisionase family DNA binding protein